MCVSPLCQDMRRRPAAYAAGRRIALAPAVLFAVGRVLGLDAVDRVGRDELHAGVDVARRLRAAARRGRALLHAQRRHLQRVLLRGRVDDAGLDAPLDRVTAAVDGHEDEVLRVLAGRLERGRATEARGLVDRVDDVDALVLLEQVLHRSLALGRVAQRRRGAHDLRVALLDAEALQEAVVAELPDGDAGGEVEHRDLRRDAHLLRLRRGVLADQLARLEVVRREQRVGGVLRLGRRVERDHDDAGVARLLDRGDDGLRVGGDVQDDLGALRRHVLHRRDLAGIVRVLLAGCRQQLDVVLLGLGLRTLLHLHEERIGLRLGVEADGDLLLARAATTAAPATALVVPAGDDAGAERRDRSHGEDGLRPASEVRSTFPHADPPPRLWPGALVRQTTFSATSTLSLRDPLVKG